MQTFRNKFEKYKDGRKSIYFSIFFGKAFLKHKDIFKKIFNSVSFSIILCVLLLTLLFQKQIVLYSFLYSIITILQVLALIICSAVVARLFHNNLFKKAVFSLIALSYFNVALLFVSPLLAQKLFLMFSIIYKISWLLLLLFVLYRVFSFILPSLKSGIISFLEKILGVDNLFKLYYITLVLMNVFYILFVYLLFVAIKNNLFGSFIESTNINMNSHFLNTFLNMQNKVYLLNNNILSSLSIVINYTYFLILTDFILILIAKIFRILLTSKVINDNPSLFKYYEDNFNIITDVKFEKILKVFIEKTRDIRKAMMALLFIAGFKVLFGYFII